jgi:uncharacterized RDD family membrane protein YckC
MSAPAPSSPTSLLKKATVEEKDEQDEVDEEEGELDEAEKPNFDTSNLASSGARLTAGLLDGLILISVVGILVGIAGAVSQFDSTLVIAAIVAYFLLGWLYYGLGESSKAGGFIGKRMTKIKVVRVSDEQIPGFGTSTGRAILKILFSLTIILPFVVFFTPRRQGLHDLLCGTIVKEISSES